MRQSSSLLLLVLPLVAYLDGASAQDNSGLSQNLNPEGDGCVDPKGFLQCYDDVADQANSCSQFCQSQHTNDKPGTDQCIKGCYGAQLARNVGCWLQGCWNKVYSCEYQGTAIQYFAGNSLVQNDIVPYYPAPNDAGAGACGCNLGQVYGNLTDLATMSAGDCSAFGFDGMHNCQCCEFSVTVSNARTACPNYNLSQLGFSQFITAATNVLSQGSTDKCQVLDDTSTPDICKSTYNIDHAGPKVLNPYTMTEGTQPLTNSPGDAFTSMSTMTLSLFPMPSATTITPAPYKAVAQTTARSGASGTASGSQATGAAVSGSGTGTAPGSSTTTGAAIRVGAVPAGVVGAGAVFALFL